MRAAASVFFLLALLAGAAPANAASTRFTTPQILKAFFPKSERVTFRRFALEASQREALRKRLGYTPARNEYVVFIALTGENVDGYAVVDEERGQHEPITFAVKLSPRAVVERQEVMVYREAYGDEVTDPRFRAQFVGKKGKDELRLGRDIDAVSGATISSRSMTIGVRRAIALVELLVLAPTTRAAAEN